MNRFFVTCAVATLCFPGILRSQDPSSESQATLRLTGRAVLVDVVVTDHDGNPVTGLRRDAFKIAEQGKPQKIAYFEEHRGIAPGEADHIQMPQFPMDVFSNFSPIVNPPAVNVLLLDSLNTPMTDQMYLRKAAEQYLKTLKPGSRLAIFTLSLKLRFVQGFSDDPAVLARALGYRKNSRPDPNVLMQSAEETNAQDTVIGLANQRIGAGAGATTPAAAAATIQSFQQFLQENQYAQTADREYRTTQALQQLATYLSSFPGRKNLIWLSGGIPLDLFGVTDMRFDDTVRKTVNLLAAARIAVYPVDARGAWTNTLHTAESRLNQTDRTPPQMIGPALDFPPSTQDPSTINKGHDSITTPSGAFAQSIVSEGAAKNSSNASMEVIAQQTGGKAFYNGNDLGGIIGKIVSSSSDFYTLSYTPNDSRMDGGVRKIAVHLDGEKYTLSYRRWYFADDAGKPGAAQGAQIRAIQQANLAGADPLQPFMDFGLPQSEQILYIERIVPAEGVASAPGTAIASGNNHDRYSVDFIVSLKDLQLPSDADGLHKGTLNISLIVYDKYGQVISKRDHRVVLNVKPEVWAEYEKTGLPLHADLIVPKGQFWLRTGICDDSTHKVGTMEVPFSSVHPLQAAMQMPESH